MPSLTADRNTPRRGTPFMVADTVAAGIGWLPLMGQAPSMVRTLVVPTAMTWHSCLMSFSRLRR